MAKVLTGKTLATVACCGPTRTTSPGASDRPDGSVTRSVDPASPPNTIAASTSAVPTALIVVCCGLGPPYPTVTVSPTAQLATLRTRTVRAPAVAATDVVVLPNAFAPTVQLRPSPHALPMGSA